MSYNFLRQARTIKNSFLCRYDSLAGYSSDFRTNGDVDGWDVYNNIYLYGCWNSVLFGTAYDRDCYIGRSNVFISVEAEDYYYIKIMMKITNNNLDKAVQGLTTGRIQWLRVNDNTWDTVKQLDFDIIDDDRWHLYTINMGPAQWWQGNINNLRIYPFIDGWPEDTFAIKFIKITSSNTWACSNTQCSYYTQYEHPCPGAGIRPSVEAGISRTHYTTVFGISDELIVNVDGYGQESFDLGNNTNVDGIEMARIIGNKISSLNIGGYTFAEVEYSENDKLKITAGGAGSSSSIEIGGSLAAEALGFYSDGSDVSTYVTGVNAATGFDYASSRILRAFEINKLVDGYADSAAYIHNPEQYNVEGGRRDFNEIGTPRLLSEIASTEYYQSLNNKGRTLIDASHPINNNGKLKAIYLFGKIDGLSRVKICRPQKDGNMRVIHSLDLPTEDTDKMYTTRPITYRLDCDILVNKGDLIGIYNADLYVADSLDGLPDATFYQVDGNVSGTFDPGKPYMYGVAGFAIYARSDRWQNNSILDIDLGSRINIEEVNIYGSEEDSYFEYNIAACLDVSWQVNLFGHSHSHYGVNWLNGTPFFNTHTNEAFGISALDDGIRTADNGDAGDDLDVHGGTYSYFFVNGDAEWLYGFVCDGKHEYCWPRVPKGVIGFRYDPIAFSLLFPYNYQCKIHKTTIYFKEENNFRNIALSYYLGPYDDTGNADDNNFRLIYSYTSIKLDGLLYEPNDGSSINDYIFNNPTYARLDYASGDHDPINWEEYRASLLADWTVLEHNFDPVDSYGFRIYTNHHNSTKITEMEVYSKFDTVASLLDNVTLTFSDYGDEWVSATFSGVASDRINAYIGGAPRYITLEFESSTEFNLNEIEFLTGDQVKLEDCSDTLLLDNAKTNAVNEATPVVLENVYEKPFDLMVDIPTETTETDDIIFWNKLNSQTALDDSEIGPGCILHKNDDYEIRNDNAQCAMTNLAYGLKNLVHGKKSYYQFDDETWTSYGVLSSGTSIDFCNSDYVGYRKSVFSFDAPSSMYWKIGSIDVENSAVIKDIFVYYDDVRVDIDKIYVSSVPGASSQIYEIDSDGTNITGLTAVEDSFDDDDYSSWTIGGSTGSTIAESGGKIYAVNYGTVDIWRGPYMEKTFTAMGDFSLESQFNFIMSASNQLGNYIIYLYDVVSTEIFRIYVTDSWAGSTLLQHRLYDKGISKYDSTTDISYTTTNTVTMTRAGSNIVVKMNGVTKYSGACSTESIAKIRVAYQKHQSYAAADEISTEYLSLSSKALLADGAAFGFKLNNSDPINKVKLIHEDSNLIDLAVYVSPNNGNNYTQVVSTDYYTWNPNDKAADIALSGYNLVAGRAAGTGNNASVRGIVGKSSGKYYWEITVTQIGGNNDIIGVGTSSASLAWYPGANTNSYGYYSANGRKIYSRNQEVYGDTFTTGDVIGIALDLDNGKIWFSKNGVWQDSGDPAAGTNEAYSGLTGIFYAMVNPYNTSSQLTVNFGKISFQHSIPMGFSTFYVAPIYSELTYDTNNQNYYGYLAVDLELRHDIEIIRNYGDVTNKLTIGTSAYTDYSNSATSNVDSVDWNNSDKDDVRWLRIKLLCGDETIRCIRKLGIYPDISSAYCIGGGYNCEWYPLGYILSDYLPPINVAYGATTTGTNYYFRDYYPDNIVNGSHTDYDAQFCWGFQEVDGVDPYLELDFGQTYIINMVKLYHGYDPEDDEYLNTDYIIGVSTTTTGTFTTVATISSNSEHDVTHQFNPVSARRLRLTITGYDHGRFLVLDPDTNLYDVFKGSFLREIEVYTYLDTGYVDSETWPVVCMNLRDRFDVTDHELINKDITDSDTDWDNSEEFFKYSDNVWDDPKKVSFSSDGDYVTIYEDMIDSSGNRKGDTEYLFEENVYFEEGRYIFEWEAFYAVYENEISLRLDGVDVIDHFADSLAANWVHQTGTVEVTTAGFYDIKGVQHITSEYDWGARYPSIYRSTGYIKWVAVTRDAAENYSYDDDSDKYGKDYLSLIKVYGDTKYNPTEYYWWWYSTLSTLSNNYLITKIGSCSLEMNYPTSSGTDIVYYREGDDFGSDIYWSMKDALNFWWYVSDINKLDTSFGDVTFGVINGESPVYYQWNIDSLSLSTGWNDVKLKFEDYDVIYPEADIYDINGFIDESLDFRTNSRDFKSFRIRYRGKGQSFTMNVDDLKIKRNIFEDDVKFGKGLCLTGNEYLDIPLSGITLEKGTIEFYLKTYYDSYGREIFGNDSAASKTLFTIVNNNNDLISLGIKSGNWFEPTVGHVRKNLVSFYMEDNDLSYDSFMGIGDVVHIALVWSNDGEFMDNGETLRFYIDGILTAVSRTTWEVEDTKSVNIRFGGSNTQLAYHADCYGSGIFDNVKIYNYCKTGFDINTEGIDKDITYTANQFMEISDDNVNFYGVGSDQLPLTFLQVPPAGKKTIYVRTIKNRNFKQSNKTASLIVSWLTSV